MKTLTNLQESHPARRWRDDGIQIGTCALQQDAGLNAYKRG